MKTYIKKGNSPFYQEFIIPKNDSYNCQNWVHIIVDNKENVFTAQKIKVLNLNETEWEVKENFTFPSSVLNSFLRAGHL